MSEVDVAESFDDNHIEIRQWLEKKIATIDAIEDTYLQMLCIFSLLEAIAFEYNRYETDNSFNLFKKFVLKYAGEANRILLSVDPVSLFYECEDVLKFEFNLDFLGVTDSASWQTAIEHGRSEEIIEIIKKKGCLKDSQIYDHTFIRMLYRQRNKLVHEHFSLSMSPRFNGSKSYDTPHYMKVTYGDIRNDEISVKEIWQFDFPFGYIRQLFITCIDNYLKEYENNRVQRYQLYPWCDRKMIFENYTDLNSNSPIHT